MLDYGIPVRYFVVEANLCVRSLMVNGARVDSVEGMSAAFKPAG